MNKAADVFSLTGFILANLLFEIEKVILALFPTMAELAGESFLATLIVFLHLALRVPILANYRLEGRVKRTFVVLPVVRVNTGEPVVFDFRERTEFSFQTKEKEIPINSHQVERLDFKFEVRVG